MEVNEEKRKKFIEYAGKRVNNVLHGIQILEPMSRSSSYDFTKQDVDEMFNAMQESLNNAKIEFEKKFEEKARSSKKTFAFGSSASTTTQSYIECCSTTCCDSTSYGVESCVETPVTGCYSETTYSDTYTDSCSTTSCDCTCETTTSGTESYGDSYATEYTSEVSTTETTESTTL